MKLPSDCTVSNIEAICRELAVKDDQSELVFDSEDVAFVDVSFFTVT